MVKFLGEMTKEEFWSALKEIVFYKKPKEKEEPFFQSLFKMVKKCIQTIRTGFTTPLTKENFIRRGLIVREIIDTIIFVIIALIIIRFCIAEIRWIPSASMRPTLIEGDRVLVERFSRFYSTPKRGDVMVFYPPSEKLEKTPMKVFQRLTGFFCKDIAYIKRVVGLPGEKLEIKADEYGVYNVYINDMALEEPYIKNPLEYPSCSNDNIICGPIIIPENHYFMMGDNRGNSSDSRFWGLLPEKNFIGRAGFVFRLSKL